MRPAIEFLEGRIVPTTLPSGFSEAVIASGISNPTAMEVAPDGRIFVAEQGGRLRVIENGNLLAQPFVTLNVNDFSERGLLGVTFDPNFATNQFVYVYYTTRSNPVHNRVSRLTANGNVAVPGSESVLLNLPNLSAGNHNGGAIHFGLDGKLYVAAGENAVPSNSQSPGTTLGKMLRINSDGSIPNDNPFFNTTAGNNRAIWALGLRNPFTFAVQPGTGRIFINDVGQNAWEEINDGIAGSNYGWPNSEGFREGNDPPTAIGTDRDPLVAYNHNIGPTGGCAIAGGAFYNPTINQFPADYTADYFFADLCSAWIRKYDPQSGAVTGFATDLPDAPVDLKVDSAGNLFFLTRGSGSGSGQVTRIQFPASQNAPAITRHPADVQVAACQQATFRAAASGAAPLNFQWQRDRVDIAGTMTDTLTLSNLALSDSGAKFRAVVTNPIGTATSNEATLTVLDDQAPTGMIASPAVGTKFNAGDTINFSGTGTDPEDGNLSASAFTWQVDFHHEDHTHPFIQPNGGVMSDSFTIPTVGETSADVFYRIHLTVTDSLGCTHSTTRDVMPNTSMITLETQTPGLQVRLDDQPMTTPFSVESVVGMTRQLGVVSPQRVDKGWVEFFSWSDGSAATHDFATPASDATFTATFHFVPYPEIVDVQLEGNSKRLTQISLLFACNLDPATATDPRNYRIVAPGPDKRFDTPAAPSADDLPILFETPQYDSPGQGNCLGLVRLLLPRPVPLGSFVQISVDGTKLNAADHAVISDRGLVLDGEYHDTTRSGDGIEGGDFVALVGLGKHLAYRDGDGDLVTLNITKGILGLTREAPTADGMRADGVALVLRQTGQGGELSGRVKRRTGDGRTTLASLAVIGSAPFQNRLQGNPSFVIGQVAAQVVDRVLDLHSAVHHRIDDLFDQSLRGHD